MIIWGSFSHNTVKRLHVAALWPRVILFLLVISFCGCDRPLKVEVNMSGSEKLPLRGKKSVRGRVTRTIINGKQTIAKDSMLRVSETWLRRRQNANPPGYRIDGYYDPATQSDGFVLPDDSIDIFYLGKTDPKELIRFVVPAEYLDTTKQ